MTTRSHWIWTNHPAPNIRARWKASIGPTHVHRMTLLLMQLMLIVRGNAEWRITR